MPDIDFLSDVGRIIWGNPIVSQFQTDDDGKPVLDDNGQKIPVWSFGFAVEKPRCGPMFEAMQAAALGVPGAQGSDFAWKYKDGDTALDTNGKPLSDRPGYKGCYVFAISTNLRQPKVFQAVSATDFRELVGDEVYTGMFVRVRMMIKGHGPNPKKRGSKPGLYLNPSGVEFIAHGERIVTGMSAAQMFGEAPRPAALPAGASLTPVAPSAAPTAPGMAPGAPAPIPAGVPGAMPGFPPAGAPGMPAPIPGAAPGFPPAAAPGLPPGAPSPFPGAPGAAPAPVNPAAPPVGLPPAPIASPSSPAPIVPAHDFVQGATGRQPIGIAPNGRPYYGFDPSGVFPIYGYDANGQPIYQ